MMEALLFYLLVGTMPTQNWMTLDQDKREKTIGVMAYRYFRANTDCAEAEISIQIKGEVTFFYGKCVKPTA